MPRVICSLPNASTEISGVKFSQTDDGMLSEEVSDEVAAAFTEINGYAIHGAVVEKPTKAADPGSKTAGKTAPAKTAAKKTAAASPAPAPAADPAPAPATETDSASDAGGDAGSTGGDEGGRHDGAADDAF